MPSISLKDDLDLNIEIEPGESSALKKYFKSASELFNHDGKIRQYAPLSLADPAVTSFKAGLDVAHPVPLDANDLKLTIKAGANASFDIFVPDSTLEAGETDSLFSPDRYGEDVAVAKTERYSSVTFIANVGAGLSSRLSDLNFGFAADSSVSVTNYQKFSIVPQSPTVLDALKLTFSSFQIPADVDDLQAMLPNSVITMLGSGSLKFSASANLLTVANPLATAELGPLFGTLDVTQGASVKVSGSYKLFGNYEIRVRKIGDSTIRLGFFKEHGTELKVTATASAGVSLSFGEDDLLSKVISALSPDAAADKEELKRANLDPGTVAAIQATVQAAIERTLEVAVSFELGDLHASRAAFLYEIDTAAIGEQGRAAIQNALRGDLSELVSSEAAPPPGIKMVRSIFTNFRQTKHTFKVNLLGIYNCIKVSKLAITGKTLFDPETGDLIVSDTATANRIRAVVVNLGGKPGAAAPSELRKVLASSLLITAAYRASGCVMTPPSLTSSMAYSEIHDQTNRETMRDELNVAVGLELLTRDELNKLTDGVDSFGRTIASATADYNDALAAAMFLTNDSPRAVSEYEDIGRQAMQIVIGNKPGSDAIRRRPLVDDDVWKRMKDQGQSKFRSIFSDATPLQIGVLTADYSTIVWWSQTMNETGKKLVIIRDFFAKNSTVSDRDPEFNRLRAELADQLKKVAADTREEFGRPWGLIAMDLLTGGRSEARAAFTGPILTLARARITPVAAGAAGRLV